MRGKMVRTTVAQGRDSRAGTATNSTRWMVYSVRAAAVLTSLPLAALAAGPSGTGAALPTGGTVASGAAVISSPTPGALTVQQSSSRAIINWLSFSIGQGDKVTFDNGTGATLNRVSAGAPISELNGVLSATGSVYLINPSGVIVGKTGVINVGGTFVASTQDVTDGGFMAGGSLNFSGASNGAVVNYGRIGALGGADLVRGYTLDDGSYDSGIVARNELRTPPPGGNLIAAQAAANRHEVAQDLNVPRVGLSSNSPDSWTDSIRAAP